MRKPGDITQGQDAVAKPRDMRIDFLRGISMILVVTGHVLQRGFGGYTDYAIFNIIWSLQIPLFIFISGYLSISKKNHSFKSVCGILITYLWPCLSYSIILGFLRNDFSSLKTLPYHLDSTLWYLFVLAILRLMSILSDLICEKINYHDGKSAVYLKCCTHSFFFFVGVLLFSSLSIRYGMAFLGIKYVLYYSIFYWVGWLCRYFKDNIIEHIGSSLNSFIYEIIFAVSFLTYIFIICRINLYATSDTVLGASPRLIAGLCGIIILWRLTSNQRLSGFFSSIIIQIGKITLQVYYIHVFVVRLIPQMSYVEFSYEWFFAIIIGTLSVLGITYFLHFIISKSRLLTVIAYGPKI